MTFHVSSLARLACIFIFFIGGKILGLVNLLGSRCYQDSPLWPKARWDFEPSHALVSWSSFGCAEIFAFVKKLHLSASASCLLFDSGLMVRRGAMARRPGIFLFRQIVEKTSELPPALMDISSRSIITSGLSGKYDSVEFAFSCRWRFSFTRNATNYRSRSFYFH